MCATYDPDPDAFCGVRLPVDPQTCEVIPERWANWLQWDPVVLAGRHAGDLKKLKALWIDCGSRDQYNLVYGARRLHRLLEAQAVARSEEHTSELQSLMRISYAVFCLKQKNNQYFSF